MLKQETGRDLGNDHLNSLLPDVQVDRRGFIAAAIAAGFAVTADPVLAQAIHTPMDGLVGGDTKIGEIPAYYAVRKGADKRPVVLVVGEIWGNHEHIKDVVRRLAKAGASRETTTPSTSGLNTVMSTGVTMVRGETSPPTSNRRLNRWTPKGTMTIARMAAVASSPTA